MTDDAECENFAFYFGQLPCQQWLLNDDEEALSSTLFILLVNQNFFI